MNFFRSFCFLKLCTGREGSEELLVQPYFGHGTFYSGGLSVMLGGVEGAVASVSSCECQITAFLLFSSCFFPGLLLGVCFPEASVAGAALGIARHCCSSSSEPGLHVVAQHLELSFP